MADPRALAAEALVDVERGESFAKDAVDARRAALADPRDRGLLTEIVYGAVRRRATIDAVLAGASNTPLKRLAPAVRAALRAALSQILFLDRVPAFAAVDAAVRDVKARTNPRFAGFANGVLREIVRGIEGPASGQEDPRRDVPRPGGTALRLRRPLFPDPAADPAANLAVRFAHPEWLVRRWLARHGLERARSMLEAGASRAPLSLRAPPGARGALIAELASEGVEAQEGEAPDEVAVPDADPAALGPVREGRAFVQDGTAQRVAALCDPRPGERILDLCAAPGGKSLHFLDLLEARGARGEVVACDVASEKVAALEAALASRRARDPDRTGRGVVVPESGPLPFDPASFDVVLVDAPCTNTGVLRRRLEVRDRLRDSDVVLLAARQRELLERALPLVRAGGRLVYATCSAEPEENESMAASFATAHPGLARTGGFDVLPEFGHDGGFAAVFEVGEIGARRPSRNSNRTAPA